MHHGPRVLAHVKKNSFSSANLLTVVDNEVPVNPF